jgi:hypothetical protein
MMTMGSPFALPLLSWRLYARSTTLKLDDAWKDRVHAGLGVAFESRILVVCFGVINCAHAGCIFRDIGRIVSVDAEFRTPERNFFFGQAPTSYRRFGSAN